MGRIGGVYLDICVAQVGVNRNLGECRGSSSGERRSPPGDGNELEERGWSNEDETDTLMKEKRDFMEEHMVWW